MVHRGRTCRGIVFGLLVVVAAVTTAAEGPVGVSPGAADRITEVEGRCPTFIWGAVPEATAYEVVVYRLPDNPAASGETDVELSPTDQVLYAELPGGATAWQPELAQALEPGAEYVWFVRAVTDADTGEASDWSAGRFFQIAAAPSAQELEQALEVLRRWNAANGDGSLTLSSAADSDAAAVPAAVADSESGSGTESGSGSGQLKSVPTATAAIRGSIPDTTGEVYGVIGLSASPDGAGVAAANLNGGPDLVLDGSADLLADTELSESGINRPSGTPQTFDITNSSGAGMTLRVDGAEVTTVDSDLDADKLATGTVPDGRLSGTYSQALSLPNAGNAFAGDGAGLTGVDADTLDGTDGAAYATDAEAAAMVSVHAASADHDGRYFTESELSTSGTANAVHWDNLGSVPSGFADGIDNDTTFSAGPGLIVVGGEIRIDPGAFSTRVSTLDEEGSVGFATSIAIGADGLGLISYYAGGTDNNLKVAHCDDLWCSSTTISTLDSDGDVGMFTSIAIGSDGLGVISYYDSSAGDLKVAHCNDVPCSSASITTLDSVGDVGKYTSIAIGADGLPLISYYNVGSENLKVAHCNDIECTSATTPTLDSAGDVGQYTSIAIGSDGFGIISYFDNTTDDLKVAHCSNSACSSATTSTLDSTSIDGNYSSIAIGADGLGLISYYGGARELKTAHCDDVLCASASTHTVDSSEDAGAHTSIAIGPDGLGLISYSEFGGNDRLKVARCNQTACSTATTATIDSGDLVGTYTSVVIGADGAGLVSYCDYAKGDLKVAHLGIGVP